MRGLLQVSVVHARPSSQSALVAHTAFWHVPPLQYWFGAQVLPHVPQLFGSVHLSTHAPHQTRPVVQQCPRLQDCPGLHALPHVPQF